MGLTEIEKIALFFLSLAAVSAIVGVAVYGNTGSLVTGSVLGAAALALYLNRSRTATLILLALVLANAWLHLRAPFSWLWVALAARAAQLAFGHRRQASKTNSELPTPSSPGRGECDGRRGPG
ncbi:MAG TPA: hypothetical protein VLB76_21780 [Thermoanaerobaculia bacterium]|jgi:hypothetical protein|nr:hypothetical protein [Thermoanaerobaculia bacterium]